MPLFILNWGTAFRGHFSTLIIKTPVQASIFTGVIEEDAYLNATIIDFLVPRKYHTDSSVFNIFDFVTRPFCSSLSHPPTPFPLVDMFLKHAFWR